MRKPRPKRVAGLPLATVNEDEDQDEGEESCCAFLRRRCRCLWSAFCTKVRICASQSAPPSLAFKVSHHQCSLPASTASSSVAGFAPAMANSRAMRRL